MQFAKASLALSLAAAAGLSGLSVINPAASEAATRCTAGTLLGRYTLKSQLTNQYVRAGIGSGAYVGAKSDRVGGNTSWETFDVYDLGNRNGLNGGTYALRSTQDPNRWVGVNNQKALQLQRGCTTNSRSRLFRANKIGRVLQLQSLANGQWVIQRSNGMLHANAATTGGNVPKALQFRMGRVSSPSPSPTPAPGPSASNLTGTWKGNNAGSPFPRLPPPPLPEPGDDPPWEFFCDTEVLPDPPFNKESDDPRLYFCPPPIDKEAIWQAKADRHAAALEKKNQLTRAAGGNFIKDPEPPPPSTVIIDAGYIGKGASSWNRNFKFKN